MCVSVERNFQAVRVSMGIKHIAKNIRFISMEVCNFMSRLKG